MENLKNKRIIFVVVLVLGVVATVFYLIKLIDLYNLEKSTINVTVFQHEDYIERWDVDGEWYRIYLKGKQYYLCVEYNVVENEELIQKLKNGDKVTYEAPAEPKHAGNGYENLLIRSLTIDTETIFTKSDYDDYILKQFELRKLSMWCYVICGVLSVLGGALLIVLSVVRSNSQINKS